MAIFNSYVSLPEGRNLDSLVIPKVPFVNGCSSRSSSPEIYSIVEI